MDIRHVAHDKKEYRKRARTYIKQGSRKRKKKITKTNALFVPLKTNWKRKADIRMEAPSAAGRCRFVIKAMRAAS